MFDLAYPLTDTVEINGTTYPIDLSFANVLRLIDLLNDEEIDDLTQINIGLEMLIGNRLEDYEIGERGKILKELFENAIGKDAKDNQPVDLAGNPMPSKEKDEKVFCLKQDAAYIYSSFMQEYRIDLHDVQDTLHWNKFQALLQGLSEDTIFKKVIDIRTCDLPTGKGSSKERERMIKLKKVYELKEN